MSKSTVKALKKHGISILYRKLDAVQKNSKYATLAHSRAGFRLLGDDIQRAIDELENEDMAKRNNVSAQVEELQFSIDGLMYHYESLTTEDRIEVNAQRNALIIRRDALIGENRV